MDCSKLEILGSLAGVVGIAIIFISYIIGNNKRYKTKYAPEILPFYRQCPELTFTISNDTDEKQTCVLFGCSIFLFEENHGSSKGIKVIPDNSVSYSQVLLSSAFKPRQIGKLKIQSNSKKQLELFSLDRISVNEYGQSLTDPLRLDNGLIMKDNKYLETIDSFQFDVTPDTYFKFSVLPRTKIIFKTNNSKTLNPANGLCGRNMITEYAIEKSGIYPKIVG